MRPIDRLSVFWPFLLTMAHAPIAVATHTTRVPSHNIPPPKQRPQTTQLHRHAALAAVQPTARQINLGAAAYQWHQPSKQASARGSPAPPHSGQLKPISSLGLTPATPHAHQNVLQGDLRVNFQGGLLSIGIQKASFKAITRSAQPGCQPPRCRAARPQTAPQTGPPPCWQTATQCTPAPCSPPATPVSARPAPPPAPH